MKEIEKVLREYADAVQENISASEAEVQIKDRKRKAHYRLLRVTEELRAITREKLEDTLILN